MEKKRGQNAKHAAPPRPPLPKRQPPKPPAEKLPPPAESFFKRYSPIELFMKHCWVEADPAGRQQVRTGLRIGLGYISIILGCSGIFYLSMPWIDEWRMKQIMSGEFQRKMRGIEERFPSPVEQEVVDEYIEGGRRGIQRMFPGDETFPARDQRRTLIDQMDQIAEAERAKAETFKE